MKNVNYHLPNPDLPPFMIQVVQSIPEMILLEKKIGMVLEEGDGPIKKIGHYIFKAGGKRFRPLLTCLSGHLVHAGPEDIVTCAAAIELIHMASLVHDDIIDNSSTRRGRQSINSRWGNQVAVLTGDFLFAKAFRLLAKPHLLPVLEAVVQAIDAMCEGEIDQSLSKGEVNQSEEDYFHRIHKKTGLLIATCSATGPLITNSESVQLHSLQNYGICVGYAFQIVDDLLDFQGDASTIGKPVGHDLKQGYLTLPLLKLLVHPQYGSKARELLAQKPITPLAEKEIYYLVDNSNVLAHSRKEAEKFVDQAKKQLSVFKPTWPLTALSQLADYVLEPLEQT